MKEWLAIIIVAVGAGLFAAGGTDIPDIGGQKWLRRYLTPVVWGICLFLGGFIWWKIILCCALYVGIFSMGYGDRTSWPMRILTFSLYGVPSLLLGFSMWVVFTPIVCISIFILSNIHSTAKMFPWKVCELIMGGSVGITLAVILLK